MPTVATLYSAGKDSTLAALLLDPFHEVVLCHCTFGVETGREGDTPSETARRAAAMLGFPLTTIELDEGVARDAVDRMVADGYPRAGIQRVHEHALETVAARETVAPRETVGDRPLDAVADGTRRDDRTPTIDRSFARSLEDRHGIDYVRPLAGYGRSAVDDLTERSLAVETGPSERLAVGDYEAELGALMAAEHGAGTVDDVFPDHVQSRVVGRRD